MCVCSESVSCKACKAAKNGVYFSQMSIWAASVTQQMVLYDNSPLSFCKHFIFNWLYI
jgi:hypothetical protein